MSDMNQLKDNTDYMEDFRPLSEKEFNALEKVTDIINSNTEVPCTSCRYCVDGCPADIPIPDYFTLYNAEKFALNKGFSTQAAYYDNLTEIHGKASDCIGCGQCERACPQHINVISYLKKVAACFE